MGVLSVMGRLVSCQAVLDQVPPAGSRQCPARQELGVYLLGAIEPDQRALVDRHLAACPQCRAELAGLAGLPSLLRRVPVEEALRLAPAVNNLSG